MKPLAECHGEKEFKEWIEDYTQREINRIQFESMQENIKQIFCEHKKKKKVSCFKCEECGKLLEN